MRQIVDCFAEYERATIRASTRSEVVGIRNVGQSDDADRCSFLDGRAELSEQCLRSGGTRSAWRTEAGGQHDTARLRAQSGQPSLFVIRCRVQGLARPAEAHVRNINSPPSREALRRGSLREKRRELAGLPSRSSRMDRDGPPSRLRRSGGAAFACIRERRLASPRDQHPTRARAAHRDPGSVTR